MNSQTNLTVGDVTADEVEVEIRTPAVSIKTGEKLTYYQIEDGVENLIGVFYAEAPTVATKTSIRFKAYDGKAKLTTDFSEWLNGNQDKFPMSLRTLVGHACETAGVPLSADSFQFDSLSIPAFYAQGVTCRQIVSWAAQIAGRFVSCNTAGEIFFDWYRKTDISIGKTDFSQDGLSKKSYSTDLIKRVQFKQETNDVGVIYPADADGNVFSISQNGIAAVLDSDTLRTIAQSLYEKLKSATYTPLSVKLPKRTAKIRAGDIISVTDGNGNTVSTYVMKVYLDGSGTQISSTGDQNYADKAAVSSEQYRNIPGKVLLLEKSVDGLRIENKDTADKVAKLELSTTEITASVESVKKTSEEALKEAQKNATDLTNYANQVSGSLTDLQNQIDGAIETWFYDYEPTTTNAPASSWTTTEDKNKHLGDLFYIVDNAEKGGLVYRWALVNGVYGWVLVEDTEVAKALETAAQAKDTADGKRRVFVTQPKPPYDVGDLWTDGANLRVCQTARASGSYNAGDWGLATEYITETSAKALINVAKDSITLQVEEIEKKTSTAQAQADKALETANGIEVGGRNLIKLKSLKPEYLTLVANTTNRLELSGVASTATSAILWDEVLGSGTYTINAETTAPVDEFRVISSCKLDNGYIKNSYYDSLGYPYYKNVTFPYTFSVENEAKISLGLQTDRFEGQIITGLKLEKGNKATDWTPAPEDTEGEIKEIKQEVSTLKVTSKGVDMVSEDSNGKLVSFIGNRDTGGVWEAKYTKNGAATSALYFDFSKGSFVFDGHVVARSGEIGGCFIVGGKLQVPAANITDKLTARQIDATDLHVKAANIDGKLTFGSAYYIDPSATTNYLMLPGLEITSSGASFTGAINGGSININDRFKVDALGNVTLPDNASISWGQVDNKPTNLATTDDIPNDDYITKITEDTVRTSNVVAKNLIVKAANIDGTLTASQIEISVGGRNLFLATDEKWVNNSYAFTRHHPAGDPLVEGETYTATICVTPAAGVAGFALYFSRGYKQNAYFEVSGTGKQVISKTFQMAYTAGRRPSDNIEFADAELFRFPNDGTVTGSSTLHWIKIEKGNTATDWTPAPEDTEATVTKITNDTIATTNVVAQNLHVKAANIDGALTFGDGSYYIDPSATTTYLSLPGITVNKDGTTVEGKLVTTAGGRVGGFFVDEYQIGLKTNFDGQMWIGKYGIAITEPSASDYWLFFADVGDDKVYMHSSCIKGSTLYTIEAMEYKLSFNYGGVTTGYIETFPSYVNIAGTWRTNGSAWIQSSDARLKNTIDDFTPAHDILFDHLRPRTYKWNEGTSGRTHSGFIVQEVVEAVEKAGLTTKDFAAVVNFKDENGEDDGWGLRYEEMISLNTWQIQKLKARIAELEGRLNYEVS